MAFNRHAERYARRIRRARRIPVPGAMADLLAVSGPAGAPQPLSGDALADITAPGAATSASGHSKALASLPSVHITGQASLVAGNIGRARFLASLGFDTAGVAASGAYAVLPERGGAPREARIRAARLRGFSEPAGRHPSRSCISEILTSLQTRFSRAAM